LPNRKRRKRRTQFRKFLQPQLPKRRIQLQTKLRKKRSVRQTTRTRVKTARRAAGAIGEMAKRREVAAAEETKIAEVAAAEETVIVRTADPVADALVAEETRAEAGTEMRDVERMKGVAVIKGAVEMMHRREADRVGEVVHGKEVVMRSRRSVPQQQIRQRSRRPKGREFRSSISRHLQEGGC